MQEIRAVAGLIILGGVLILLGGAGPLIKQRHIFGPPIDSAGELRLKVTLRRMSIGLIAAGVVLGVISFVG